MEEGKIKSSLISLQSHMGSSHMGLCRYNSLKRINCFDLVLIAAGREGRISLTFGEAT